MKSLFTFLFQKVADTGMFACFVSCLCFFSSWLNVPSGFAQTQVAVNTNTVIASGVTNKYGVNLNAGLDLHANRPAGARPRYKALQEMGVKHLRYPGGKKSLYYIWATDSLLSDPTTQSWVPGSFYADNEGPNGTLNFDQFIALCRQVGEEPHINVAYNPGKRLEAQLAAEWVRYANVTKNYGVKYWEIQNEMWDTDLGLSIEAGETTIRSVALTNEHGIGLDQRVLNQAAISNISIQVFIFSPLKQTTDYAPSELLKNSIEMSDLAKLNKKITANNHDFFVQFSVQLLAAPVRSRFFYDPVEASIAW